jgi:alpha-L-rhamnosidase
MNRKDNIKRRFFPKMMVIVLGLMLSLTTNAQTSNSIDKNRLWKASWITVPEINPKGYGVYLFRKGFELTTVPKSFPVLVSADNRYKLFVNGKLVSVGPARGDVSHWNFETVDLTTYLQAGRNIVSALVWNEGDLRQESSITFQTGFILQGGTEQSQILNTDNTWKCVQNASYEPINVSVFDYYVAGTSELIDMQKHISGFEMLSFNDSNWKNASIIAPGCPTNTSGLGNPNEWMLVSSFLPQMESKKERLVKVRLAKGVVIPSSFPVSKTAITIPANTEATILLDQLNLTNAYPTLIFSGGKNGNVTLKYAESLFTKLHNKGNRNEVDGKIFIGRKDSILSDGSELQNFTSLSYRTYRYLQIKVITKDQPLVLEDIYGTFTGYPFTLNAKLVTDNTELKKIVEIGWRTARLCAMDTYMDCPYYEQLQYIGDTRIQALVSLYNSGDDRLVRNALNLFDYSIQPNGITMSRYPTITPQFIPPFSLMYIGMLHDYMMYGKNSDAVKEKLVGVRRILAYFKGFQQADGSLFKLPGWNFTDWVDVKKWPSGVRKAGEDGNSALLDLQLLWAYELAADMEQNMGLLENADVYKKSAEQLKLTIQNKYWDSKKSLFADKSEKDLFSQHTNTLAILTGVVSGDAATKIGKQLLSDSTLAPTSIYFKYYLHQALVKAGLGDGYLNWLGKWRENMAMGLTTWGENSNVNTTRSDCHAWGASPNIEFFRTILGIDSDAPGFSKVKIEPHLGALKSIGGVMPHPNGKISVDYKAVNGHLNAKINLPLKTTGQFIWKGKIYPLKGGQNIIKI